MIAQGGISLHPIRRGEHYSGRCEPMGCCLRESRHDGVRVAMPEGDVVFPAAEVLEVLAALEKTKPSKRKGKR